MDYLLFFLIWSTPIITVVADPTTIYATRNVSSVLTLAHTNSSVSITENLLLVTTSSSREVSMFENRTMVTTAETVGASETMSLRQPGASRSRRTAVATTITRMRSHNTTTPSHVLPTKSQSTTSKTLVTITLSTTTIPHVPLFTSSATRRLATSQIKWRVTTSLSMVTAVSSPSSTRTTTPTDNETKTTSTMTLFGLTEGEVKHTFLAAISLAGVCLIFSIVVCCYYKCKIKDLRKQLEGENATVNTNPYRVGDSGCPDVSMYPAHLQLDSFTTDKTESPYDVPDQQRETDLEVPYDDVKGVDESEPRYADLKREEMTNNIQENQPQDSESPVYSNASALDTNPYQALISRDRENDPQYTSLIQKDTEPEDDVAV